MSTVRKRAACDCLARQGGGDPDPGGDPTCAGFAAWCSGLSSTVTVTNRYPPSHGAPDYVVVCTKSVDSTFCAYGNVVGGVGTVVRKNCTYGVGGNPDIYTRWVVSFGASGGTYTSYVKFGSTGAVGPAGHYLYYEDSPGWPTDPDVIVG